MSNADVFITSVKTSAINFETKQKEALILFLL